jgi:hypothetical protein
MENGRDSRDGLKVVIVEEVYHFGHNEYEGMHDIHGEYYRVRFGSKIKKDEMVILKPPRFHDVRYIWERVTDNA